MDVSFWQQVERARRMTGEEKVRESLRLFDRTRRIMLDGLRNEYPDASVETLRKLLQQRLAINRATEHVHPHG